MLHLKEYDEKLIDDLEELGVNEKLRGWWVQEVSNVGLYHWYILERDFKKIKSPFIGKKGLDIELNTSTITQSEKISLDKVDNWEDFFEWIGKKGVDSLFRAWEMKPKDPRAKNVFQIVNFRGDLTKIIAKGNEIFSDFQSVLDKSPEGQYFSTYTEPFDE